jgi:hypothetical protein
MEERTSRSGVEARGQSRGQRKTSRRNSPTNSPVLNPYYPELHVHDTVEETRSKYDVAPVVRITHYQTPGVLQTLKTPIQTVKQVAKRSAPIPGPTGGKHANSTGQRDLHSWSARVTDSGSISCSCSAGVRVGHVLGSRIGSLSPESAPGVDKVNGGWEPKLAVDSQNAQNRLPTSTRAVFG